MRIIIIFSLILLTSCTQQSELDQANKRIAELEAQLQAKDQILETKLDKPQQVTEAVTNKTNEFTWEYSQDEDKMSGEISYKAFLISNNTVNFKSPYDGYQHGILQIRTHPRHGKDVIFSIERGQILCSSYDRCKVLVRFDDEKPMTFNGSPPSDNSSEYVFLNNYSRFMEKLLKAKLVRIAPEIYQEGSPVFEFNVFGFSVEKYRPKK